MRSLNLSTRCSLTSATVGSVIGSMRWFVTRSMIREHVPFARRDEQDRFAAAARAAGATDAVNVRLGVVRNVVVDDVRDALDVEAARRDIRRDDDVELAVLEARDRAIRAAAAGCRRSARRR